MTIPIVVAFTPSYFVPAAVMLHSILGSTICKETVYEVYCLVTEDIPERQKTKLEEMAGGKMSFIYVNLRGRMDGLYVDPKYSEAASYRLLLPELFPELDKVLYVDCDVVVKQDVAVLFNKTDLTDSLLAAVFEAPIEKQAERWEALGCDSHQYFNSGVLLMNLAQMRIEGTSVKLMKVLDTDYLEFPDQDALNIVCKGRVRSLSPVYNGIRTFFLPQYKGEFVSQYSEELWQEVQSRGSIHYTGGKPWNILTVKFEEWWEEYKKLTAGIKKEWNPSLRVRVLSKIYSFAPMRSLIESVRNFRRLCMHI